AYGFGREHHIDPRLAEAFAQSRQVSAVVAVDQHQIDEPLGKLRGGDAGQHLDVGQLVGDVLRASDEPDSQAARQRLGKAARVDYAVELVERREPRRRLRLQIAEDVIFHDGEVVAL